MIWIARLSLPGVFWLVLACPAAALPLVQSTFDSGTNGWGGIIVDGSVITTSAVSFVAGAGNPGGALRHDAPSDSATSFFRRPQASRRLFTPRRADPSPGILPPSATPATCTLHPLQTSTSGRGTTGFDSM